MLYRSNLGENSLRYPPYSQAPSTTYCPRITPAAFLPSPPGPRRGRDSVAPFRQAKQGILRLLTKPWVAAWAEWFWALLQRPTRTNLFLLALVVMLARRR